MFFKTVFLHEKNSRIQKCLFKLLKRRGSVHLQFLFIIISTHFLLFFLPRFISAMSGNLEELAANMPPDATASDQEKDVKEVKTKGSSSSFVIYYVSLVFQLNDVMTIFFNCSWILHWLRMFGMHLWNFFSRILIESFDFKFFLFYSPFAQTNHISLPLILNVILNVCLSPLILSLLFFPCFMHTPQERAPGCRPNWRICSSPMRSWFASMCSNIVLTKF